MIFPLKSLSPSVALFPLSSSLCFSLCLHPTLLSLSQSADSLTLISLLDRKERGKEKRGVERKKN